jgi:signal transduction histidine kinase
MELRNIEIFFLNNLLKICIGGVLIILLFDSLVFPEDKLSIYIDACILTAATTAYLIRTKFPTAAILIMTTIVLAAMLYQSIVVPLNTTTSLSIILVVGFIYSVMLKGAIMRVMHAVAAGVIVAMFTIQFLNPSLRFSAKINDVITVAITYSILYFILTYATAFIKSAYDKIYVDLSSLNAHLEETIKERTGKIQIQNEALLKYSYANAHHLRGPVARLLGLANLSKIKTDLSSMEIISRMEEQAKEIDEVVKQINKDLELDDRLSVIPAKQLVKGELKAHTTARLQ